MFRTGLANDGYEDGTSFPKDGAPLFRGMGISFPTDGTPFTKGWGLLYRGMGPHFPRDGNRVISGWQRPSMNIFHESDTHMLSLVP